MFFIGRTTCICRILKDGIKKTSLMCQQLLFPGTNPYSYLLQVSTGSISDSTSWFTTILIHLWVNRGITTHSSYEDDQIPNTRLTPLPNTHNRQLQMDLDVDYVRWTSSQLTVYIHFTSATTHNLNQLPLTELTTGSTWQPAAVTERYSPHPTTIKWEEIPALIQPTEIQHPDIILLQHLDPIYLNINFKFLLLILIYIYQCWWTICQFYHTNYKRTWTLTSFLWTVNSWT